MIQLACHGGRECSGPKVIQTELTVFTGWAASTGAMTAAAASGEGSDGTVWAEGAKVGAVLEGMMGRECAYVVVWPGSRSEGRCVVRGKGV